MFLSLFIIFFVGIIGGIVLEKIRIPKIIWYLILGILMSTSVFNIIDEGLLKISSYLRQIALVIILTRSGLSLDLKGLKEIGRPAILMCFLPALFEIIGIAILGPILLGISILEALLLGSVLAAVSPAVVAPRMIKLIETNYGKNKRVPELILAGASCDDIFVIVLFYSFKNLVATNSFTALSIINIPISILSGIVLGILLGFSVSFVLKKFRINTIIQVIVLLALSFGSIALEEFVKPYFAISSLLGIIVMALIISLKNKNDAKKIQSSYNSLWQGFEILLFVLVGASINISYAISSTGLIIIGLVVISLLFRTIGVLISLLLTNYNLKERIFIIISYLPKATVQASIGGIALAEGLACGEVILTAAIIVILITAPLGAILMDNTYKKLLCYDNIELE